MNTCNYCARPVIIEEWGSCYTINPFDESVVYSHIECIEVNEDVVIVDSRDDEW